MYTPSPTPGGTRVRLFPESLCTGMRLTNGFFQSAKILNQLNHVLSSRGYTSAILQVEERYALGPAGCAINVSM